MKLSRDWLSDYVDLSGLPEAELRELITTKIAEVDGTTHVGVPLESAVVAKVLEVTPHPKRDKLKLAKLSLGESEMTVVCGASNCSAGMVTAYVPIGTVIPSDKGPLEVGEREIAGVVSRGLLASPYELDIAPDHSGIIDLNLYFKDLPSAGTRLKELFGGADFIIEVDNKSLTHRPDLWSHFGFARELAAVLHQPLKRELDRWADDSAEGLELLNALAGERGKAGRFSITITEDSKCRRMSGIELSGLKQGPSPLWMQRRLFSIGSGVKNLLVDVTNYVMNDLGQPVHGYDVSRLPGSDFSVRLASGGEVLKTLDGEERTLSDSDVVIACAGKAVALAGVIGGDATSITEATTGLFIESACFDPALVRHTTKRHGVRTDASNRFEKNQSPFLTVYPLHRIVQLLREVQPELQVEGSVSDFFPKRPEPLSIVLHSDYVRKRLGAELADSEIESILGSLSFGLRQLPAEGAKSWQVSVPHYRATKDISIADDLVEEVGRIYGYERVPEEIPLIAAAVTPKASLKEFEYSLSELLRGAGFSETYTHSFVNPARTEALGYSMTSAVTLRNAVDTDENAMRVSLVPGMLLALERNVKFEQQIAIFELGRSYSLSRSERHQGLRSRDHHKNAPAEERRLLAFGYVSGRDDSGRTTVPQLGSEGDFFAAANLVQRVCRAACRSEVRFIPLKNPRQWMHPYRAAEVFLSGERIGELAEVRPGIVDGLKTRAVVAELDCELLLESSLEPQLFTGVSRFPDSFFELSVVMPEGDLFETLRGALSAVGAGALIRGIEVISIYRGKPLQEGQKSVSVRLSLGKRDGTLSREELSAAQEEFMSAVSKSGYSLRQ